MATSAPQLGLVLNPQTDLQGLFDRQRAHAPSMARTTAHERRERLARLRRLVVAYRTTLAEAVHADFGRPVFESELTEIHSVLAGIDQAAGHVARWMRPTRRPWASFTRSSRPINWTRA